MNSRSWKIFIAAIALVAAAHCTTTDRTRRGYLREQAAARGGAPARPVIVVPGFGVTRLFDPKTNRHVWGTARATVHTRFADDLDLPVEPDGTIGRDRLVPTGYVGSRGPVNIGWQLTEGLRKFGGYTPGVDVHPFHYDWRLSAIDNARELDALIERVRRERNAQQVDLVTHSAGALVALTYVKLGGGAEKVANLVLVAPTQRGVVDALRVFVRPERFIRREFSPRIVATWPFIYELLPRDLDFVVDAQGQPVPPERWTRHFAPAALARGRELRARLDATPLPPAIAFHVLAGDCVATARRVLMRDDGTFVFYPNELRENEAHLAADLFEPGDGTVPVSSATAGGQAMLFCDGHQGIAADPHVHRALIRILRPAPPGPRP